MITEVAAPEFDLSASIARLVEAAKSADMDTVQAPLLCDVEMGARTIALDENARTMTHVISTARLDRANRIVDAGGWRLADYRAHPIVLMDHNYSMEAAIGRGDPHVRDGALLSTTTFGKEGAGNVAFRMVQAGMPIAWSVGWRGVKAHAIGSVEDCAACQAAAKSVKWGTHFTSSDLMEYSMVAVPANPDAVSGLLRAGLVSPRDAEAWRDLQSDQGKAAGPAEAQVPSERSPEFYRQLFTTTRSFVRRASVLRLAQKARRA